MSRKGSIFLTLFILAGVLGCDESEEQRCQVASDCPLPLICFGATPATESQPARGGRCIRECRVDSDCPDGLCIDDVCRTPDGSCRVNEDCVPFGRTCDPGSRRCLAPCGIGQSCPQGSTCVANRCQPTGQTATDTGSPSRDAGTARRDARRPIPDARAIRDSRPPRDARPGPDARPTPRDQGVAPRPDMMVNRGNAQYGDPCRCGADCQSGLCVPNPYNQFAGQCSASCGGGVACPGVDRCIDVSVPEPSPNCPPSGLGHQVGAVIQVCIVNETGLPCSGGRDCVIDGICNTPPNPIPGQVNVQSACGTRCQGDLQCPPGYRCGPVSLGGGQMANICTPATEIFSCPDGSNQTCGGVCPAIGPGEDEVAISHCIVLGPNQPGYCSCACNSAAQCPAGFACSRGIIETGLATRPGICLPISGYTCPMGHDNCLSQGCAPQLEAEMFPRCTAPCVNANDCPTGYRCINIPDEGGTYCIADPR